MRLSEGTLDLPDGRTLRYYDTAPDRGRGRDDLLPVWWHHGSPNVGRPPEPLFDLADELGVRWLGHDRPGYAVSTRLPGRTIGDVAADVTALADHLGIDRLATMGHSGGGPHAVATGVLLGDRVSAVVSISGPAPRAAAGLDWYAGIGPAGTAELRAAEQGADVLAAHLERSEDQPAFTPGDIAALQGDWSWFIDVVRPALEAGPGGFVDDDVALVTPWGADPAALGVPALFVHGTADAVVPSSHSAWLATTCPDAELWERPGDGHIAVMAAAADALRWLVDRSR